MCKTFHYVFVCLANTLQPPYASSIQFSSLALIRDTSLYALSPLWLGVLELPLQAPILPPLLWNELILWVLIWLFNLDLGVICLFDGDAIDPSGVLMLIFALL
jgi:hypothetical protein